MVSSQRPGWPPPPAGSEAERQLLAASGRKSRPGCGLLALVIGIACSLVVAWNSYDYFVGQAEGDSPSVSFVYSLFLVPLLFVGVPLTLVGSLLVAQHWSSWMRRLPGAAVGAVALWWLLVLQGPALLVADPNAADPNTLGTGTVDGLPGQEAPWSGVVECESVGGAITSVTVEVPAGASGSTTAFHVYARVRDGNVGLIVGDAGAGGGTYDLPDRLVVTANAVRGEMVASIPGVLHRDDPTSVVTVTWDCGGAPNSQ